MDSGANAEALQDLRQLRNMPKGAGDVADLLDMPELAGQPCPS